MTTRYLYPSSSHPARPDRQSRSRKSGRALRGGCCLNTSNTRWMLAETAQCPSRAFLCTKFLPRPLYHHPHPRFRSLRLRAIDSIHVSPSFSHAATPPTPPSPAPRKTKFLLLTSVDVTPSTAKPRALRSTPRSFRGGLSCGQSRSTRPMPAVRVGCPQKSSTK